MGKVVVMDHPLIQHKIGLMRRTETGSKDFRTLCLLYTSPSPRDTR